MKIPDQAYYFFLATNDAKTILETGVAGNLGVKLQEMETDKTILPSARCTNIIYLEDFEEARQALNREKEIKKWRRKKKEELVKNHNPEWKSLNELIYKSSGRLSCLFRSENK